MEILRNRYSLILPLVGLLWSCSDPIPETDAPYMVGEWVIEEVNVSFDVAPSVTGFNQDGKDFSVDIPAEVQQIDIHYSQESGFIANDVDYTDEINFANEYSINIESSGFYSLESKEELAGLNLLEFLFQYAGADMIMEFFPDEYIDEDYGNGEYEYYESIYSFYFGFSYFMGNLGGTVPQEGMWEMVNDGYDILFDFKDPLYRQGLNLWEIEWISDTRIRLIQYETPSEIILDYDEESDYYLNGQGASETIEANAEGELYLVNASIVLSLK